MSGGGQRFRFRSYRVVADPTELASVEAVCVSRTDQDDDDAPECAEGSGEMRHADALTRWMVRHTAETGHCHYQRVTSDYAVCEAGEWS